MSFFSEISHVNFISLTAYIMISYVPPSFNSREKTRQIMKWSTQASLTDMFNKMSKVSKPTRPESSEEMQQVHDRQDQVAITSSSIQFETSKGMYLLYPRKESLGVQW